jgi:hypothetical protein
LQSEDYDDEWWRLMDEELKNYLDEKFRETREYVREQVDASETRLLGQFWKWARTADARYRQEHGAVNGLAERVGIVEDRVAELERGKRSPG